MAEQEVVLVDRLDGNFPEGTVALGSTVTLDGDGRIEALSVGA